MVPKPAEVTPFPLPGSKGLYRHLILTLLVSGLAAACQSTPPPVQKNLDLGTRRQLLFNDSLVSDLSGEFQITPNPAQRTEGPVLSPEEPWERYGLHSVSVVEHDGLYRLWYGARGEDKVGRLCYATSSDGIHWTRPSLGIVEYEGSKENNIVLASVGSVFLDPSASDEKRFKLICGRGKYTYVSYYDGGARFRYAEKPPASWHYSGIGGAYSPDGVHWTYTEKESILPWYTDTANVAFWDDRIRKYVAFVRWNEFLRVKDGELRGSFDYRAIARSESEDFENFPEPEKILEPDFDHPEDKDLWGGGLYDSAAIKYPFAQEAYFIFTAAFHHSSDTLDIQLAASSNGKQFKRWREPFVRLGRRGQFDSGMMYMGRGLVARGDELWMYYSGYDRLHDQSKVETYSSSIGRIRVRRDGFVSRDASAEGATLTTHPFELAGNRLEVNMDASSRGWLKAEILDESGQPIPGFGEEDADRLDANDVHRLVTWKRKEDLSSLFGRSIRLRFRGQSVKLYAFQFLAGE
jgi:hypothetical protein